MLKLLHNFLFVVLASATLCGAASTSSVLAQTGEQQTAYVAPALQDKDAWTMVVIPDPQAYSRYGRNQGIFELMTAWIAENKDALSIRQVLCVGDLVESNGLQKADGKFANQTGRQMWTSCSRAFERLDGVVPYVLCTGNHDYGPDIFPEGTHYGVRSSETRDSLFGEFFPMERNPLWKDVVVECFPNAFDKKTLENAAYEFEGTGGQKILVVSLEFAPRPETLEWAKALFARPEYANHFGIVLTHSYLRPYTAGLERDVKEGYGLSKAGGAAGETIWQKLAQPSSNIRLVICGHHSTADNMEGCAGFRVDKNAAGKTVSQLLFDTQAMGGGWEGNGGDGWLQLLEFSKDMKTVKVRTFSPLFAISPSTRANAWNREKYCEFEFSIE
ncbi:MAG: metallophosphoesterase [Thermoguttaceae bacterium]|nr:metallophosphoesterase [Thermoguttaceae bacterium]